MLNLEALAESIRLRTALLEATMQSEFFLGRAIRDGDAVRAFELADKITFHLKDALGCCTGIRAAIVEEAPK